MDISRGLITKVIDDSSFKIARKIGPDHLDEDCIPVFNYIKRHYTDYKSTPSRDAINKAFPSFEFTSYKEPIEYFIDELDLARRKNILDEALTRINSIYVTDPERAETELRRTLSQLHSVQQSHRDVDLVETSMDRFDLYEDRERHSGADGILSNWPTLDYQTLGWHAEEFIVLVGEKYMGKSWKMVWLAYQAAVQGENVLFVTKEMAPDQVSRRFDSIYAQVEFDSLRRGELSHVEKQRYKDKLEELHVSPLKFTVARAGVHTIEDIEQKALEIDASIVFADSVYLFPPDSTTRYSGEVQKRMAISQKCKGIAQNLSIPFICSVQGGRRQVPKKGPLPPPDLDGIEWSNAFSQDADTVFYTQRDSIDRDLNRSQMWLLKSRDGDLANFFVNEDFNYMQFTERADTFEPRTQVFEEDEEETLFDVQSN